MNKYQEALDRTLKYSGVNKDSMFEDDLKTLQELVDKETPKEVALCVPSLNGYVEVLEVCPSCEIARYLKKDFKYCPYCGQTLVRSELL
ncbi:MAG: hypothetical protein M0Q88_00110 [Bacilli bacterium]|nr:hypothetical protein [Bacilli bacterium]